VQDEELEESAFISRMQKNVNQNFNFITQKLSFLTYQLIFDRSKAKRKINYAGYAGTRYARESNFNIGSV